MGDEPNPEALLVAMAATLAEQVVPATSGGAAHAARVVENLCRILAREAVAPGAAGFQAELLALLGSESPGDATLDALLISLDDRLRRGDADFARRALPILRRDVERRLAISKPSYLEGQS